MKSTHIDFQLINPLAPGIDWLYVREIVIGVFIAIILARLVVSFVRETENLFRYLRRNNNMYKQHDAVSEHIFRPRVYEGDEIQLTNKELTGRADDIEKIKLFLKPGRTYVIHAVSKDAAGNYQVTFVDFPTEQFIIGSNFVWPPWEHGH